MAWRTASAQNTRSDPVFLPLSIESAMQMSTMVSAAHRKSGETLRHVLVAFRGLPKLAGQCRYGVVELAPRHGLGAPAVADAAGLLPRQLKRVGDACEADASPDELPAHSEHAPASAIR